MNLQERARIMQLIQVLDLFKDGNSTIPLQQVIAFLRVACDPGIGITKVAHASQTHVASSSRHARALRGRGGAKPALLVAGYGKDERTKPLLLTDEGRHLVNAILAVSDTSSQGISVDGNEACAPAQRSHCDDLSRVKPNRVAWDPFGAT